MSNPEKPDDAQRPSAEKLFAQYVARIKEGQPDDLEETCSEYPEASSDLRRMARQFRILSPLRGRSRLDPGPTAIGGKGETLADYRLIRPLGSGGMGEVWEAEQISIARRVALKFLRPEVEVTEAVLQRFQREAEASGRLPHPMIVMIHGKYECEGKHFIVQELVEGGRNLQHLLDEYRKRDELPRDYYSWLAAFFQRIAEALQFAHDAGVIHRDIKPANILISSDGRPKITDFGLAQLVGADPITITGQISGTCPYMSPEQTMAKRILIDARTDVFSLAATFYEALTLTRAFDGDSPQQVMEKILLVDPPDPRSVRSRVPYELSVLCMKGLEKGRSQRYQTMAELAEDLRRYQDGEPLHARPPGPLRRVQKWGRRHPTASVGLGVALAAMFVISALLVQTVLAKSEAEQQSEIATQQRFNVLRLADLKILVDLEAQAAELWPAHPELTEDLADWVFSAEKLVAKLPQHEAFLEQLEDSSSSARDLSESELVWWKTTLADLVFDLRAIADPESGTLADVRQRLLRSESIEQETIGDYEEEWEETLFELSESEIYDQLVMEPQIGLVPLGPDPESGLWEFWHVDSGPQPQRDEDSGQLRMSAGAGIILVLLPGGTQPIGAQKEGPGEPHFDDWTESDEVPVHSVNLAPFFLSKFEMTQSQWQTVTGVNPSNWNGLSGVPGNPLVHPVEDVTWEECVATLRRVDLMLPTEAQWEYGARAETRTAWWTGERRQTLAGAANLADRKYAEWFSNVRRWDEWLDDGFAISAPVGSLRANDFGLHDVTGNVWEWCRDPYLDYQHPARDGDGLRSAEVVEPPLQYAYRGASFDSASILARVANRNKMSADGRNVDIGVRPCRAIDGQTGRSEE